MDLQLLYNYNYLIVGQETVEKLLEGLLYYAAEIGKAKEYYIIFSVHLNGLTIII
jgi:hypothetical protein